MSARGSRARLWSWLASIDDVKNAHDINRPRSSTPQNMSVPSACTVYHAWELVHTEKTAVRHARFPSTSSQSRFPRAPVSLKLLPERLRRGSDEVFRDSSARLIRESAASDFAGSGHSQVSAAPEAIGVGFGGAVGDGTCKRSWHC